MHLLPRFGKELSQTVFSCTKLYDLMLLPEIRTVCTIVKVGRPLALHFPSSIFISQMLLAFRSVTKYLYAQIPLEAYRSIACLIVNTMAWCAAAEGPPHQDHSCPWPALQRHAVIFRCLASAAVFRDRLERPGYPKGRWPRSCDELYYSSFQADARLGQNQALKCLAPC